MNVVSIPRVSLLEAVRQRPVMSKSFTGISSSGQQVGYSDCQQYVTFLWTLRFWTLADINLIPSEIRSWWYSSLVDTSDYFP